jgi:hypothetical protein
MTTTRATATGMALYDANPGAMSINGGFNKIRGISLSNPRLGEYMQAAEDSSLGWVADLGASQLRRG